MREDLRFAVRNLRRTPGFWLLSVLILGLGVGANASIYSTIRRLVLAPFEELFASDTYMLNAGNARSGQQQARVSLQDFLEVRKGAKQIAGMEASQTVTATVTGVRDSEIVYGSAITAGILPVINAKLAMGRAFLPEENRRGAAKTVILKHGFWQRKFGADPAILGKKILLDGEPHEVVGVTDSSVWFPSTDHSYFTALNLDQEGAAKTARNLSVFARLQPGTSLEQANAEVRALSQRIEERFPDSNKGWDMRLQTTFKSMISPTDRVAIVMLFVITAGVLLIACANVSNLLMARAVARRKEIAVRLALGADRWQLVRLALIEALLLAVPAAGAGLLLSFWAGDLLSHGFNSNVPLSKNLTDWQTITLAIGAALVSTLFFGLAPALRATSFELAPRLREGGGRGSTSHGTRRMASAFVVAQVSLALAVLGLAGLLIRTVVQLHKMEPGFQTARMTYTDVRASLWRHKTPQDYLPYFDEMMRRVAATPGVEAVGGVALMPSIEGDGRSMQVLVEGRETGRAADAAHAYQIRATAGAIEALRIPMVEGRTIQTSDTETSVPVAVINQTMAKRFWPGGSAVGQRFRLGSSDKWIQVAGVYKNLMSSSLDEVKQAQFFVPYRQDPAPGMSVVARTSRDEALVLLDIQKAVRAFDPEQPASYQTVAQAIRKNLRGSRTLSAMLAALGGLALALAAVGLFALLSHSVRQRMPEIGIRMALGATQSDVVSLVFRHGARLAVTGLVIGFTLALALGSLAGALFNGVGLLDPVAHGASIAMLALATVLACWFPARAAAKADPAQVLKAD